MIFVLFNSDGFFPGLSIGESGVLKSLTMTVLAGPIYGFISKIVSLCN